MRENTTRATPAFSWCLALTALALAVWMGLDGLARADALLNPFRPWNLCLSVAMMVIAATLIAVPIAGTLWLGELALSRWPRLRPGALTTFVLYAGVVYVNVIYLRFYCSATEVVDIAKARWGFVAVLLLGLALYRLRFAAEMDWLRQRGPSYTNRVLRLCGAILTLALLALAGAALTRSSAARSAPSKPHLVIVTCDAMRAQSTSLYGYSRPTTPNLERLASSSYVFERFRAASTGTEHAMPAFKGYDESRPGGPDLLEELRAQGYESTTFISFTALTPVFRRGFTDTVLIRSRINHPLLVGLRERFGIASTAWLAPLISEPYFFFNIASPFNPTFVETADRLPPIDSFRLAVDRLRQADHPSVIWVHLYQPHFPYYIGPNPPFGNSMRDRYDAAILVADQGIGALLESLRSQGLWDRCLFVFSADHGEAVGEKVRGRPLFTHGADWSNEMVADVPLLIHRPGQSTGARIATHASQLDFAPTILALLGLPVDPRFHGESLLPYMESPSLLSDQVKLCVPASYWVRQTRPINPDHLPENWVAPNFEEFLAYAGRYELRWLQKYPIDKERPQGRPEAVITTAVYDVLADPPRNHNLYNSKSSEVAELLARVEADPKVKATRK